MNNSIFWARVLGLYAVIAAVWTFMNHDNLHTMMTAITENPLISITWAFFSLLLGLVIVVGHQVWKGWPILVTLLGLWITIKGIILLFFPQWVQHFVASSHDMTFAGVPAFIIGVVLLYFGFVRK